MEKLRFPQNTNVGIGLTDALVRPTLDPETGEMLAPFGIEGGSYENAGQEYKKFKTDLTEKDAVYIMKANLSINSEGYSYLRTQMNSGKLKFLIEMQEAKTKLMQTKKGRNMYADEKNEYLMPFEQTNILRDQLLNLIIKDNNSGNIILEQESKGIPKDKVSALMYGMYYIKQEESRKKNRSTRDISKLLFMN